MLGAAITTAAVAGAGLLINRLADYREAEAEARYPPEGQLLDVGGCHVHAYLAGDDGTAKPDLVLLHGASGSLRDFTFSLIPALSPRYRVLALDRPGLGWTARTQAHFNSPWTTRAESPAEQAAVLSAAAASLGITRPIVLGHSYGGAVALAWALAQPDRVASLVVLSGVSNPWPGGLGPLYTVLGTTLGGALLPPLITAAKPYHRLNATLHSIFTPDPVPQGYARHIGAGLTLRRDSFRANARQLTTLRPHIVEMSRHYASLPMPVEIVHGTADTVVPAHIHAHVLARQLPDARLTVLPGIGHMPHHACPDAVIDAIDRAQTRAQAAGRLAQA
jgi:pimeloyl-ACP methyl ester carboxylesterase